MEEYKSCMEQLGAQDIGRSWMTTRAKRAAPQKQEVNVYNREWHVMMRTRVRNDRWDVVGIAV